MTSKNKLTNGERLMRIETEVKTRFESIDKNLDEMKDLMEKHMDFHTQRDEQMKKDYVNKNEFAPVKNVVYGLVGIILISVIGAVLALIINNGGL